MTTTNKQLQEWLQRFPDDIEINVLTSVERRNLDIDVYKESLELPDVTMSALTGWDDFPHVVFDVKYDYDGEVCTGVKSITLGKAHSD